MKIIAHRGNWKEKGTAQNAISAIKAALHVEIDGVETDLRMSKDGILFLYHDASINRKPFHQILSADIEKIRLKSGEKIARFDEFIEVVKEKPDFLLYLELKSVSSKKYKTEICQKVTEKIKTANLTKNTRILSFDLEILEIIGKENPELQRLFLIEKNPPPIQSLIGKCEAIGWCILLLKENPELITASKKHGFSTNTWTVNKKKDVLFLKSLQPASATTDFLDLF